MTATYTFQAEIRQLLYTLIHSLYQDREIFLRELISNGSDALNRVQFESLTRHDIRDGGAELTIRIKADTEANTLTISDSGIGMTREELIDHLGTISKSGVRAFLEQAKGANGSISTDIIGQFGVGFYSIFMVADKVEVHTLSYLPEAEPVLWTSTGEETYEVDAGTRATRGTDVILYLKEDAHEFLQEYRLRQIIKTHSNYVAFPIFIGDGEEPVNEQKAIWRRPTSELTDDDYNAFYKSLTLDFKDPLLRIHTTSDGPTQYYALLYIPTSREPSMFTPRKEVGLQLYARKILIQDYCTDLLPDYLSFVQGAVDSEDLPLNVSRETVQANKVMQALKKAITGKVLRQLKDTTKNEPEAYIAFWGEFGPFIKQGMITDPENKERLLPLLRFHSTTHPDELITLDDYVQRMQEVKGQEAIYYVLGDNQAAAARSPHLEPFRARGIEVLYFTETVDSFLINSLFEYNDHPLKNVDDADLDLSEVGEVTEDSQDDSPTLEHDDLEQVRQRFEHALGERVKEVRISKVLTGTASPARLVSPEGSLDRHTQRVYRMLDRDYEVPQKILELNPHHPIIFNLGQRLADSGDIVESAIEQIYENALLLDGLHPNPAEMVERIQQFMQIALGR